MLENFRLRVFRAVAEHLSFRKAGETLYLSQPAVTLQIRALEEELGASLFERGSGGVKLTRAGEALLVYARQLHKLAQRAEAKLAGLRGAPGGELLMGASTTIAQYIIPRHLATFARKFPAIRLKVFSGNSEYVAEGVASGRFGLGLIEGPPLRQDLTLEPWFEDELMLAASPDHGWARTGGIKAAQLTEAAFIIRERGSGSRHVIESNLRRAGVRLRALRVVMELDSTEAILSSIEAGLGVGIVSKWALERRLQNDSLVTIAIAGLRFRRMLSFVLPRGPGAAGPAENVIRFLREVSRDSAQIPISKTHRR